MPHQKREYYLVKTVLAIGFLVSSLAWAHGESDDDYEMNEQAHAEQYRHFEQLRQDIENGAPIDVANDGCKYISSIFQPPPLNVVYLTFDDGPSASITPLVLNLLKKYGIKATFFMKGDNAQAHPAIVRRVKAEGHLIGNHSWSHPSFHAISTDRQVSEMSSTDKVLRPFMGALKMFRYPYGNSTCFANSFAHRGLGYNGIVGWHVDSCDWAFERTGSVRSAETARNCEISPANVANYADHVLAATRRHAGGVILFHAEIHPRSAQSLEEIILRLKRQGYSFGTLDDPRVMKYFR